MAAGRTRTTWTKGQGGKTKGAKDRFPRTARAAVTKLLEDFGNDVQLIEATLKRGLAAKPPSSFPYLKMVVEQNVGQAELPVTIPEAITFLLTKAPCADCRD